MSSRFTKSEVTIMLNRAEAWEVEETLSHLKRELLSLRYEGQLMIFVTEEYVDQLGWSGYRVCGPVVARNLPEILFTLMAKDAISVTLLSEFWSNSDGVSAENDPSYFEDLAEQIPTLVLREVLARRLGDG